MLEIKFFEEDSAHMWNTLAAYKWLDLKIKDLNGELW